MTQESEKKVLTYYQCIQLLEKCVEHGVISKDPKNENNILVYRTSGVSVPEGWYSQNLMEVALDLLKDIEGQEYLLKTLVEKGIVIEFNKMPEPEAEEEGV